MTDTVVKTDVKNDNEKKSATKEDGETKVAMEVDNFYVVYTRNSLEWIQTLLRRFGRAKDIGPMRIDYDRRTEETNRTLVAMKKTVYDKLVSDGLVRSPTREWKGKELDFNAAPYKLMDWHFPDAKQHFAFFVVVPEAISADTATEVIREKLQKLEHFGMIKRGDVEDIRVPLKSREGKGQHAGRLLVRFRAGAEKDEATRIGIALARVAIDLTYWGDTTYSITCLWERVYENKYSDHKKEKRTTSRAPPRTTTNVSKISALRVSTAAATTLPSVASPITTPISQAPGIEAV